MEIIALIKRLKSLGFLAGVLLASICVGSLALWAFPFPGGLSSMGNGIAALLPGSPVGSTQFNNGGSAFGGNGAVLNAAAFAGADWCAKVGAALTALGGRGTVDATSLMGAQSCANGLTLGVGQTVLSASSIITVASGKQIVLSANNSTFTCSPSGGWVSGTESGDGVVLISGDSDQLNNCVVENTDTTDAASSAVHIMATRTYLTNVTVSDGVWGLAIDHGSYYSHITNLSNADSSAGQIYGVHIDFANAVTFSNPRMLGNANMLAMWDIENARDINIDHLACEASGATDCFDYNVNDSTGGPVFFQVFGGYVQLNTGETFKTTNAYSGVSSSFGAHDVYLFNWGAALCSALATGQITVPFGFPIPTAGASLATQMGGCGINGQASMGSGDLTALVESPSAGQWFLDTTNNPTHKFGIYPYGGVFGWQRDDQTVSGVSFNMYANFFGKGDVKAVGNLQADTLKTTGAAGGKVAVCVDTATGILYASSASGSCAN
jgi:hypothetical protein